MTYVPGIPNASDIPSVSQGQIKTNFTQLNTLFAVNHYPYDYATVADRGKHKFTTLVQQGAGPATAANEIALYSKSLGGNANLFYRRAGSGTEISLTGPVDPLVAGNGRTFLPGGLMLQWGTSASIGAGANLVINFPTVFTAAYVVTTQEIGTTGTASGVVSSLGAASFKITNNSSVARSFYWMAIGSK